MHIWSFSIISFFLRNACLIHSTENIPLNEFRPLNNYKFRNNKMDPINTEFTHKNNTGYRNAFIFICCHMLPSHILTYDTLP